MNEFTGGPREKVLVTGIIFALVIVLVLLFLQMMSGSGPEGTEAANTAPEPTAEPDDPSVEDVEDTAVDDVYALLPYTQEELAGAAGVAREFAVAHAETDPDESHEDRLDRLREFTGEDLSNQLDTLILTPPNAAGPLQPTTAVAEVVSIANVGEESVTYLVDTHTTTETNGEVETGTVTYSVTLVREGGEWRVFAFGDASVSNPPMGNGE